MRRLDANGDEIDQLGDADAIDKFEASESIEC